MLNEFRSTNITWDKATSRIYSPVTANESDENGRKLVVQVVNSGQVEDLTGATLHLYWETRDKAHDGLDVFKAVDLKKGEFELSYTTGMLSNQGVLNANLVLIDTVGRIVSERFKVTVTEGIDNDAIQSENSFTSLTQALIDISDLEQNYAPRLNDLTAQLQQTEQELNAQLAHTKNKTKSYTTYSEPTKKPMVSFVDDDGYRAVLTKLKPLFFEKQVPYNLAIITGVLGTGPYMYKEDLKDLYNNGWEFLGHGHTVTGNLTDYPNDDDLDYQLSECKRFLNNEGYAVSGFVYPQSAHSKRIRMFTKKHYDFAFANTGIGDLLNTMALPRISFGSWTDGNPTINGNSEKNTLAYYKACVDYAFDNNTWLTFMTHCASADHDDIQAQHMSDLVDYIKAKNISIVTVSEGYITHGNKLFNGDLEDNYTIINDVGIHTNALDNRRLRRDEKNPSAPISDYENLTSTSMECSNNFAVTHSLPGYSPGILTTVKYSNTVDGLQYNSQRYTLNVNNQIYARKPISMTEWGSWELITYDASIVGATSLWRNVGANFKPATALSTEYANNRISVGYIYGSGTVGFPNNSVGLLTTYRISGFGKQIFQVINSHVEYSRYVDTDGSWSDWVER